MKLIVTLSLVVFCASATLGYAQQAQPRTSREDALDPSPIDPSVDPNIDMFVNDWKNAAPRSMYGGVVFRDILTRLEGPDPLHPTKKGAVLVNITAISRAELAPGARASGRAAAGERQVFFTMAGTGTIAVNSKSHEVRKGVGFTLTPDTAFTLSNTGEGAADLLRPDRAASRQLRRERGPRRGQQPRERSPGGGALGTHQQRRPRRHDTHRHRPAHHATTAQPSRRRVSG